MTNHHESSPWLKGKDCRIKIRPACCSVGIQGLQPAERSEVWGSLWPSQWPESLLAWHDGCRLSSPEKANYCGYHGTLRVPLSGMKCITEYSANPSGSVVCFVDADPPPVWVLIVQSMGPSRASEPSLALMSLRLTKQGGRAFWSSRWITSSSVCLFPLFETKPFYRGRSELLSVSVLEGPNEKSSFRDMGEKMNSLVVFITSKRHQSSPILISKTDLRQDQGSEDETRWRRICRMYKDVRSSRVAGKRLESVLILTSTKASHHRICQIFAPPGDISTSLNLSWPFFISWSVPFW